MVSMLTEGRMTVRCGVGLAAMIAALASFPLSALQGQRSAPNAPPTNGFITGVVQGGAGPEAGVWVIAETKGLPTNFIKIVVTDDQGRFTLPELPAASYGVWVRGYGLGFDADSGEAGRGAGRAQGDDGEDSTGSGKGVSGQLLAVAARAAGAEGVSGHRA